VLLPVTLLFVVHFSVAQTLPQRRRRRMRTKHQVHMIHHIREWWTGVWQRMTIHGSPVSGGVGRQRAVWSAIWVADLGDRVCRLTAGKWYIFDGHWYRAVGDHAEGSDGRLAGVVVRSCPPSAEDVTAEQTPEQNRVDDAHYDRGRRDTSQVDLAHSAVPEQYAVGNPHDANKSAADESDQIRRCICSVQHPGE